MDAWQGPRFQKRRCSYGPDQGDMLTRPGLATPRPHLPKALRPAEGDGSQPQTLLASLFPALRASPRRLSLLFPQRNPVAALPAPLSPAVYRLLIHHLLGWCPRLSSLFFYIHLVAPCDGSLPFSDDLIPWPPPPSGAFSFVPGALFSPRT